MSTTTAVLEAAVKVERLEAEYGRLAEANPMTKEYAREHIEPTWTLLSKARSDLQWAVRRLNESKWERLDAIRRRCESLAAYTGSADAFYQMRSDLTWLLKEYEGKADER